MFIIFNSIKISNGIILQFGYKEHITNGGATAYGTVTLFLTYSSSYSITTSTARHDNLWAYSDLYSCTTCAIVLSQFNYRCIAANNAQYITGFYWQTVGY